tara:strand:+ start:72630 stop:73343 length:714 start_codon:yes stop_codon:yes gene_type:complete
MSVIIETYKTKDYFWDFKSPTIYHYLSILTLVISFIILALIDENEIIFFHSFFTTLAIISIFVFITTHILFSFSYENLKKIKTGVFKISKDAIVINNQLNIFYEDIDDFEIYAHDYKGRAKYLRVSLEPNLSLGLDNSVKIKYQNKIIEYKFEVTEEREIDLIYSFISSIIIKEKFKKVSPRKLVSFIPEKFRRTEEYRQYISEHVKDGNFNSIEGLLMMSYKSDQEAIELRKKYSL